MLLLLQFLWLAVAHSAKNTAWNRPLSTNTNNFEFARDGPGTNGFLYTPSSASSSGGPYNYCNMPHVAPSTYTSPDPNRYTLEYVEITHRHHRRTPYASNMFPREDRTWDCADTRYRVSMDSGNINAANTRWKTYQDPLNPLRREGYHGDCQFPQITAGGLQDSLEHGRDLYAVYGLRLGLTLNTVRFRVTNNVITSQVAGAVVRGMFPHGSPPPVELRVQYADSDSLEPSYTCPAAGDTRRNTTASRTWMDHLEASRELFARLDAMSDVNPTDPGWHNSLDHYFDSFTSRMCHGMPLPCSVSGSKRCVSREDVDQVLRWGQWEYSFLYRDAPQSLDYARMRMGVFLAELVGHLSLPGNVKYRHNVGHDGSISLLLSALQVEEMVWPGLGAEIAVELWHERAGSGGGQSGGGRFVRVLWGGKVMPSSSALGRLDMIPLGVFVEYLTALSGTGASEVMKLCGYEG